MAANNGNGSPNREWDPPKSGFNTEEMLRNLAEFIAQQMNQSNNRSEGRTEGCSFDQFNKQHTNCFHGKPNPVAVENWILDIGELFSVLGCTDEQKVMYVAYKLSEEAKR